MPNPYLPPASPTPAQCPPVRNPGAGFTPAVTTAFLLAALLGSFSLFIAPRSARLFGTFLTSLPAPTVMMIQYSGLYWLPLVLTTTLFITARLCRQGGLPRRQFVIALYGLCAAEAALGAFTLLALCLPVIRIIRPV